MKLVDHHEVFNTIQRVLPEEKGNVVPKVRIWFGLQDLRLDSGFWPYSLEAICGNMVTRDHREWKIFCQITAGHMGLESDANCFPFVCDFTCFLDRRSGDAIDRQSNFQSGQKGQKWRARRQVCYRLVTFLCRHGERLGVAGSVH